MDSPSEDKHWAAKYLLDPLTAPGPSEETGPGSHFVAPTPTRSSSTSKEHNTTTSSSRSKSPPSTVYPTPPSSASPTRSSFHPSNPFSPTHRQTAFGEYANSGSSRRSLEGHDKGRQRVNSLGERFPGDMSHRPLDQIRREVKAANRAPHLKKKHMPGADTIDILDASVIGGAYHHEGPYDATLLARNTSHVSSPVDAVRESNAEAIRATPREHIRDALDRHVPLQGTASIPPGMAGMDGRTMQYEEGTDMMRETNAGGGAYKRWADVKYLPDDYKGKGEPSYSLEKALKSHNQKDHRRIMSDGNSAYEMQPSKSRPEASRQRSASGSHADLNKPTGSSLKYSEFEDGMRRSNTTGRRVGEGLRKRFGTLRKSKRTTEG